jgi:DNA polymerase-3 subunit alpha
MYGTMEMMVFGSVLEKSSFLLMEGNIVEIHARISVREDEEPKLMCDEIISAPNPKEVILEPGAAEKSEPVKNVPTAVPINKGARHPFNVRNVLKAFLPKILPALL